MEQLGCEICFENYDDLIVVPKVLDCGHTMCGICIYNMKGNDPKCPTCRQPVTRDKVYATNYSLLSLVQEKKNIRMKVKTIKEESSEIIGKLRNFQSLLTQNVEPQQKATHVMENFLNKLRELKVDEETDVYTMVSSKLSDLAEKEKTSKSELKTLKRKLEIVTQCLALMEVQDEIEASGCGTSPSQMTKVPEMKLRILWRDGDNSATYLKRIRERLRDKLIYVEHPYEGKILYGRLVCENFSLPENWKVSTLEERELPNGAYIVEFQDLKKALTDDYSLNTFLEVGKGKNDDDEIITIDLIGSSRADQFVKLCTGECGVSYKHCDLKKEKNVKNPLYYILRSGIPCKEMPQCLSDMYLFFPSEVSRQYDKIVYLNHDGVFRICKLDHYVNLSDVVGVAKYRHPNICPIKEGDPCQIKDCGIYFRSEK